MGEKPWPHSASQKCSYWTSILQNYKSFGKLKKSCRVSGIGYKHAHKRPTFVIIVLSFNKCIYMYKCVQLCTQAHRLDYLNNIKNGVYTLYNLYRHNIVYLRDKSKPYTNIRANISKI